MEQDNHVLMYSIQECEKTSRDNRLLLDKVILDRWDKLMQKGHFRYNLDTTIERVIGGSMEYIGMFLPYRNILKRPPQSMQSVKQEFDIEKFNFNKIDENKELVCQLLNLDRVSSCKLERDIIIINVSPIDRGHCLIVPQVEACLPQVLTAYSIMLVLEVMNISTSPHTKISFNSLRAYASVNHLHWHYYYQHHQFAVQSLPLSPVPLTPYHVFKGQVYPAVGWVWLLREEDKDNMNQVAREVVKLTSWLTDKEVAHNVFLTRGAGVGGGKELDYVRLLVWARESVDRTKDCGQFVMTATDLSGQVSVFEKEMYNNIMEDDIATVQREVTQQIFRKLKPDVERLFSDYKL